MTTDWERPPFKVTAATLDVLDALADGSCKYAREIAQETGRASGSVTNILARLMERGWARAAWDTDDDRRGPRRRFFWIDEDRLMAAQELLSARRPPTPR